MMAFKSSASSLSFSSSASASNYELSAFFSSCSSPLPLPPLVCNLSVPFHWEEKPGITKPAPPSTIPKNLFYGTSLHSASLPPPPCISHPRCSGIKLLTKRSNASKPSKEDQLQDPFFLALKVCTKVDKREEKPSYHGLPAPLTILKPTQKSEQCKKGACKKTCETRRWESFNHHRIRRESSSHGEGDGGGKSVATSSHGTLQEFFPGEEKSSGAGERGSTLYTLLLQEDKEGTNSMAKKAHQHMNAAGKAASRGCVMNVGVANRGKQDDPMQGLHGNAARREHLLVAEYRNLKANGHRKPKHKDANDYNARENNQHALDSIQQKHIRAKHSAQFVEFKSCGGYLKTSDKDAYKHHASKLDMFSDLLGCKALSSLNGTAIHPSLHF